MVPFQTALEIVPFAAISIPVDDTLNKPSTIIARFASAPCVSTVVRVVAPFVAEAIVKVSPAVGVITIESSDITVDPAISEVASTLPFTSNT